MGTKSHSSHLGWWGIGVHGGVEPEEAGATSAQTGEVGMKRKPHEETMCHNRTDPFDFDELLRNISSNIQLGVLLTAMALVAVGCAHDICFKTVDATTGAPLPGTSGSWRQDRHDIVLGLASYGPTNLPPSGQDGVIHVHGLRRNWTSRFVFTHPGYSNVYGIYSRGGLGLDERVWDAGEGRFTGQFTLEGKLATASLSNGCFVVPLPQSGE